MNRRIYLSILASALICLTFGVLTGCSSSSSTTTTPPPPTIAITAASGDATQNAAISTAFPNPLGVNVTSNGSPDTGVTVTYAANTVSGATCTLSATTATTDANGNASVTCTANATTGTYTVTATVSGASTPATFTLTNTTTTVTTNTYVFYASGQDTFNLIANPNNEVDYYAVAGAVTIDASGNVDGGELDYNNGNGITSGSGSNTPDSITGGTMTTDPTTGVGTLTLVTSNASLGGVGTAAGTVELAVQFVNDNHALISEWDGFATSSGSFDLQNLTLGTSGQSSFAISGVDSTYSSVGFGGIFSPSSATSASVTLDVNDFNGAPSTNNPYTATIGTPDSFGRVLITGITNPVTSDVLTFAGYPVTQEAIRLIDIDQTDSAVGSAYGQGSAAGTFSNASFGTTTPYVFNLLGQWSWQYGTLAQFSTDGNGNITSGVADDNEIGTGVFEQGDTLSGTYNITGTGYSTLTPVFGSANEDVNALGVYMVDPALNINDPNNTTTDLGGAVVLDLSSSGETEGGIGVITPATDTTQADFSGNYAAGFQDFNFFSSCGGCEFDMVGPFSMTATTGPLATATIGAEDSDPFGTWDGTAATSSGDVFTSTPVVTSTAGYYNGSPLAATINTAGPFDLTMDLFQASATTLYWIEMDQSVGVFIGPIEGQGDLSTIPALKKPGRAQSRSPKPANPHGGPTR